MKSKKYNRFKRRIKNNIVIPLLARAARKREVIHILHVAKTGGTALLGALPFDRRLDRLTTDRHDIYFRNHSVVLAHIPQGQKVVFGLRDPISRFVSGFYSRKRGGRFGRKVREYEAQAFETFATPRDLARSLYSEDIGERANAEAAIQSILHTRVKLSNWVGTPEDLAARADDVAFVYQQENLDEDFALLIDRFGLSAAALPQCPTQAHRLSDGYDMYLDDRSVQNLRRWYAEDYNVIDACIHLFESDGRMTPRCRMSGAA